MFARQYVPCVVMMISWTDSTTETLFNKKLNNSDDNLLLYFDEKLLLKADGKEVEAEGVVPFPSGVALVPEARKADNNLFSSNASSSSKSDNKGISSSNVRGDGASKGKAMSGKPSWFKL